VLGRLSFATNYHDALVDNRIGPDVWEAEEYNGRGQLLLKLSDNAEFLINMRASVIDDIKPSGHYNEPACFDPANDFLTSYANPAQHQAYCQRLIGIAPPPESTDCFGFVGPDNDPFAGSYDDKGVFSGEFYGATGTLEWDLGGVQLTSATDFQTLNKEYSAATD